MKTSIGYQILPVSPLENLTEAPLSPELIELEEQLLGDSQRAMKLVDALGAATGLTVDLGELSPGSLTVIPDSDKGPSLGWSSYIDEEETPRSR